MSRRLDSAGVAISVLCIAHCVGTSVLLIAMPALARQSDIAEGVLVGMAVLVGLRCVHRSRHARGPVAVRGAFIAALALVVGSRVAGLSDVAEGIMASAGSITLIGAHVLNCGRRGHDCCARRASGARTLLLAALGAATLGCNQPLSAQPASEIRTIALRYVGLPYRLGGATPRGLDCAALVQRVYRAVGVALPRTAAEQFDRGCVVLLDELRPGDLVFFRDTWRRGISHVGIFIGRGRFVHAAGRRHGVCVTSLESRYYRRRFAGARRLIET
jgi:hypothetical protein